MNIKGITTFVHFSSQNGLIKIDPELQSLYNCVEEYKKLCGCDPEKIKTQKWNRCSAIYNNFMRKINQYKSQFLSKTNENSITFFNDSNNRIITISR
jgi:hypothetical protein